MTPRDPVRASIVGLGWWGGELVMAAKKVSDFQVTACFARTAGTRNAFAAAHGLRPLDSWEAVLKDGETEAILLATPHLTHARMVEEAASAGKHIFVEKPFVLHVPEGQRAIAACERAGVRLAVGHQRRFQPAHRELKRLIETGELGHAIQAEANFSYGFAFSVDKTSWRAHPDESPAGAMTGLGIHHADNLQYLLGPVKSVFASSRSVNSMTDLDDVTAALLEFESGAHGYLATNMLTPKVFYIHVFGTDANVFAEDEGTKLTIQRKGIDEPEVREFSMGGNSVTSPLVDELEDFAAAIRENRPPEADGMAGLRASAVLEGIVISARENRRVELNELYE